MATPAVIDGKRLAKSGQLSKAMIARLVVKGLGKPLEEMVAREAGWDGVAPTMAVVIKTTPDRPGIEAAFYHFLGKFNVVGLRYYIISTFKLIS